MMKNYSELSCLRCWIPAQAHALFVFGCVLNISPFLSLSLSCSFDPSLSYEERERRMRQAAGRAGFVQDILLSTLLAD